jgi:protocatechuate 3,4-dioxygenase beta subunit
MLRWMKWVVPVAGMAMVFGFNAYQVRADDTVPPASTQPAAKATVTVNVVDGDGKPVSGAMVSIVAAQTGGKKKNQADPNTPPPAQGNRPTPIATGTTDAEGKAVLAGIPDGKYTVRARAKAAGMGRENVTVVDQKDASVTVTLKPRQPKNN